MKTHNVKSWSYLFQAIISGIKFHDVRDMRDRDYKIGDQMMLEEFDQTKGKYTGRWALVEITYITDRDVPCAFSSAVLDRDFGILSIKLLKHGDQHGQIFPANISKMADILPFKA